MAGETVRLTVAQALVRFLGVQFSESDGVQQKLFAGCLGIFGHGNVAGFGQALLQAELEQPDTLPYVLGRNEQAMVHTAVAYARMKDRPQMWAVTTSVGPGATNMLTGAALATINRLPVLLLPSDTFADRTASPLLQELEQPYAGDVTVNDCFRPVSRYFDRISVPEQLPAAVLSAMRVLTDPAETGAVTLCLPQDVQAQAYDWPVALFRPRVWHVARLPPEAWAVAAAAELIRSAKRPLIVAGGGVAYSGAQEALARFCEQTAIPVGQTQAGKGTLVYDHPQCLGAVGSTGSTAANRLAREADLDIGIGTRYSDFTTASRTAFQHPEVRFVNVNVASFDPVKHGRPRLRPRPGLGGRTEPGRGDRPRQRAVGPPRCSWSARRGRCPGTCTSCGGPAFPRQSAPRAGRCPACPSGPEACQRALDKLRQRGRRPQLIRARLIHPRLSHTRRSRSIVTSTLTIGTAPDSWGVWFPSDPAQLPAAQFLREVVEAGYGYIELGPYGYLPKDPAALQEALDEHHLKVLAGTVFSHLHQEGSWDYTWQQVTDVAALTEAVGGKHIVVIPEPWRDHKTGAPKEDRELTGEQWDLLTSGHDELGRRILDEYGLHVQFHSHADSHVGYQPDIERFVQSTNPDYVNLCLDTGHVAYYGGDNLELIAKYPDRIGYLHLKQVNPEVIEQVLDRDISFPEAVRMGAMIEPPLGVPEMGPVLEAVTGLGRDLSAIIEHDLYPCPPDLPLPIAKRTRTYLGSCSGASIDFGRAS